MLNKLVRGEKGQALLIVLIMVLFGSLTIPPVLSHIGTGLWTGKVVYEERMKLLYAADAGVEDALWWIKNATLDSLFTGYDQYNYTLEYGPHTLPTINDAGVGYKIKNVWIPKDINTPSPSEAKLIIEGTEGNPPRLMIVGGLSETSATKYQIGIIYYYGSEGTDALKVKTIGIWLPPGFNYAGNCNLASDPDTQSWATPVVSDYRSGKAVVWTFGSPMLKVFPGITTTPPIPNPMVSTITFDFTGPAGRNPAQAISWVVTTGCESKGITYTWDADTKIYEIKSTATYADKQTEIDAYAAKIEPRDLGSTLIGDYWPIGATLMTATSTTIPNKYYRDRLYLQTDAVVGASDISPNATIEGAYLYWSGWIDHRYREQYGTDRWGNPKYRWGEIPELNYDNYVNNLTQLVEQNAKVNTVTLTFGTGSPQTITSNQWQVKENTGESDIDGTWSYSCFYNATELVQQLIADGKLGSNGSGTYRLGHAWVDQKRTGTGADTYYFDLCNTSGPTGHKTGYPLATPAHKLPYPPGESFYKDRYQWSYAGWSLILMYSTPGEDRRQFYIFQDFRYISVGETLPFTISGFLAPEDTTGSKLTYFVGEGDAHYGTPSSPDYIKVNGVYLSDAINPWYNVFNSESNAIQNPVYKSGIDVDTFDMSDYIEGGDPSADIVIDSGEILNLVYIILSFRSEVVTGGTITYLVY